MNETDKSNKETTGVALNFDAFAEAADIIDEPKLGSKTTDELLEYYTLSEGDVAKYEKARGNYYQIKNWPSLAVTFGYILGLLIYGSSFGGNSSEIIGVAILGLSLLFGLVIFILKHIFWRIAKKQNISSEEATYHRLANAIKCYRGEHKDIEGVKRNLSSVESLLKQGNNDAFNAKFKNNLSTYIGITSESGSENTIEKSFPMLSNIIIQNLSLIHDDVFETVLHPSIEPETVSVNPSTRQMILSYFRELFDNRIIRISAPLILSTPVIISIYYYIGETAAQFVLLSVIAISQIYYNLSINS